MTPSTASPQRPAWPAGVTAPDQLPRLLPVDPLAGPTTLAAHVARYSGLPTTGSDSRARDTLVAEVGRAGLTGRGGAAFPTARKLAAVARSRGRPVVVAN